MAKQSTNYSIILQGHTPLRFPYTIKIVVLESKISTIEVTGKANLNIIDLCQKFAMKHPANIEDVAGIIKLEMIKRNEYTKEIRQ